MIWNNIIRSLRLNNSYTQQQIADFLCICQKTYSDYELGYTRIPIDSLIKLARLYDVDMNKERKKLCGKNIRRVAVKC